MKTQIKRITLLLLVLAIGLGLLLTPQPAQAALSISGIVPNVVSNTSSVDLLVTGSDFQDGAVVIIEGVGVLSTTYKSSTTLLATLPAGLTPGSYTVIVANPDSSQASLPAGLTVTQPTATAEPGGYAFERPLIVVGSYSLGEKTISPGQAVDLLLKLENRGQAMAFNLVVTFTPGDFVLRGTGGVLARDEVDPQETARFTQPMTASNDISGKEFATLVVNVRYTDLAGTIYTETFNLAVPVKVVRSGGPYYTPTPTPTPTPVPILRPQILISAYRTDVPILQPGYPFNLAIEARNVGSGTAKRMTMILGGGSSSGGGAQGTPEPGGISGASGDFGNFAPLASSNVQFLGDALPGDEIKAVANLIVNATTNPGAYPMRISFTYTAESGVVYTDDQVITLLVYSPPQVEISFYRDPGQFFAGQPSSLPVQVVNLGRKVVVLGSMKVSAPSGFLENSTTLVGYLDTGLYYTLDALYTPDQAGPMELTVTIEYTDDFNQPQVITRSLPIEVQEAPVFEPEPGEGVIDGGEGMPGPVVEETWWQVLLRFFKGLFGLDSAPTNPETPIETLPDDTLPGETPQDGMPGVKPAVPVPGPKG